MKVPPQLEAALNESGFPWEVQVGKKHRKIRMAGRLVTILPHGPKQEANMRVVLNTIRDVRQMAAKLRGQDSDSVELQ